MPADDRVRQLVLSAGQVNWQCHVILSMLLDSGSWHAILTRVYGIC
jgi:hypothetical protein